MRSKDLSLNTKINNCHVTVYVRTYGCLPEILTVFAHVIQSFETEEFSVVPENSFD